MDSGKLIPAISEDIVSSKAALALGASLIMGLAFWIALILLIV